MSLYIYTARDGYGQLVKDKIEVKGEVELDDYLKSKQYTLINFEKEKSFFEKDIFSALKRVSIKELSQFTIQLSTLIEAGIPLISSLDILYLQLEDGPLKPAVFDVSSDIRSGLSFSKALEKHDEIFGEIYIGLVKAGEVSGALDLVLMDLAKYLEKTESNRAKVKSALTYPLLMLFFSLGILIFLLAVVLPGFVGVFEGAGIKLPLPTRILLRSSFIVRKYWYLLLFGGITIALGINNFYKTKAGRKFMEELAFNLPVFGNLITKSVISRFTRTFAILINSSVPILHSLDILKESSENTIIKSIVDEIKINVNEGGKVSTVIEASPIFPLMVGKMVDIGEESGSLDKMLFKVSDFYDMELDNEIKSLTSIIEPLLIVTMGGFVGFIVLAIMLPMFDMIKIAKG